jgi:hypothetical protein
MSWASTDSGGQQRSQEATPMELTHMAATPALKDWVELCRVWILSKTLDVNTKSSGQIE